MVEVAGMNVAGVDVNGVMSVVSTIIWVLVAALFFGGILWYVLYWKKYNKIVLIRDETSGGNIIRQDKAREMYDEKNILVWKIRKEKITVPCPPKSAISIKGSFKFAELVRVQGDQYHWLNVSQLKEDAQDIMDTVGTEIQTNSANKGVFNKIFAEKTTAKVRTGQGRYFVIAEDAKRQLADQIKKAEQERTTKANALIQQLIPILGIGILLIGAYFIYDAVGSNMSEMADKFAGISGQNAIIAEQNSKLIEHVDRILSNSNATVAGAKIITLPAPPN